MSDDYGWAGGREACLRLGPRDGATVVIAPALFEEANRTRAFTVAIMRHLATHGLASILPDLPGANDSLIPTAAARLADWRAAFACMMPGAFIFAVRGGALVDGDASVAGRYHLSPVDGADLVRDLMRTRLGQPDDGDDAIELAGNVIARPMLTALGDAVPLTAGRTARLEGDPRPADIRFAGRTLWRAAEPGTDPALAEAVANDVADWIARCGG